MTQRGKSYNQTIYNEIAWVYWPSSLVISTLNGKKKKEKGKTDKNDPDLFVSMLQAVMSFIEDSTKNSDFVPNYSKMDYWAINFGHSWCLVKILQYSAIITILSGIKPDKIESRMYDVLKELELENIRLLQNWTGEISLFDKRMMNRKLRKIMKEN